jgi:putative oxidoreductase
VAAGMMHVQHGFFMYWYDNKQGEGFEYHVLGVAIVLALMIRGAGLFFMDRCLTGRHDTS